MRVLRRGTCARAYALKMLFTPICAAAYADYRRAPRRFRRHVVRRRPFYATLSARRRCY
jgi:hypothetical protein